MESSIKSQKLVLKKLEQRVSLILDDKHGNRERLPLIVDSAYRTATVQTILELNIRMTRRIDQYHDWMNRDVQQKQFYAFLNIYCDQTVEHAVQTLEYLMKIIEVDPYVSDARLKKLIRYRIFLRVVSEVTITIRDAVLTLCDIAFHFLKWVITGKFRK